MNLVASGSARGNRIDLDVPLDLPDGTPVDITVQPKMRSRFSDEEWDEWIKKVCGAWANRPDIDAIIQEIAVSAELRYGAEGATRPEEALRTVEDFLEKVHVVPFGPKCAEENGRIRYALKRAGRTTGATDTFIAATAVAYGATLITHNTKHFQHVPGLRLEDCRATA
jgi:predicted nucleic acid-binding protein